MRESASSRGGQPSDTHGLCDRAGLHPEIRCPCLSLACRLCGIHASTAERKVERRRQRPSPGEAQALKPSRILTRPANYQCSCIDAHRRATGTPRSPSWPADTSTACRRLRMPGQLPTQHFASPCHRRPLRLQAGIAQTVRQHCMLGCLQRMAAAQLT